MNPINSIAGILWLACVSIAQAQIAWNGNNWALACDFRNNDLSNAQTRGEDCGSKCQSTPRCTHFTWTNFNGGTCWMKKGAISKSDAVFTNNNGMVCGIANGQVQWNGNWAFDCDFKGQDLSRLYRHLSCIK